MIRIFGQSDTTFTTNGDAIILPSKAKVKKSDNGDYYLTLETNLDYIDLITEGRVVVANTPQGDQAFRISNVKRTKSKITSKCYHVFYDSKNYVINYSDVVSLNCKNALAQINGATEPQSPFVTDSDISSVNSYTCDKQSLYGAFMSLLGLYGGHLVRDNFNVKIMESIGMDNGIIIQYKKNLKDITCTEDWSKVVTKLLPVGKDGVLLNALDPSASIYVESVTQYDVIYCKTVQFSQDINRDDYPDDTSYLTALVTDLNAKATAYVNQNCTPSINYTLKANLEKLTDIGDIVEVKDERFNIDMMAKVISFEYDCIAERYTEVVFGNFAKTMEGFDNSITAKTESVVNSQINKNFADSIISQGITDGWYYRRYASGVIECWKQVTPTVTWSAFGSYYKGSFDTDLPYTMEQVFASIDEAPDVAWIGVCNNEKINIVRVGNTGTIKVNIRAYGRAT